MRKNPAFLGHNEPNQILLDLLSNFPPSAHVRRKKPAKLEVKGGGGHTKTCPVKSNPFNVHLLGSWNVF